jgi:hypothetical protein
MIIYGITQKSNYKKAQDWLRDYSSSLLVMPSVLFNVLALIVLNRFHRLRNYSQTSTTFYMKVSYFSKYFVPFLLKTLR